MTMRERGYIPPEVFFLGGLLLLVVPLPWLAAWAAAAGVHELGHLAAIALCGGKLQGFRMGLGGAELEISGLTHNRELICSLAGPALGLLLLFLCRTSPRLALCALVQSAYNLLPVFPLDGGRALRSLLSGFCSERTVMAASRWVSTAAICGCFLLALTLLHRLGRIVLLFPVCLLLRFLKNQKRLPL